MAPINRAFKDSVFRDLFGSERWKQNTLSLYNALNGTAYADLDSLELTTIDNAIYMGYKNDISFLIGGEMVLWEHQSTLNPNMPLRGLMYFAELYSRLFASSGYGRFSTKLLPLPTPRYYVFYVGADEAPEREVIRLSSSFSDGPGDVEVSATVLNVNEGSNRGIMEACKALSGYAHLVELFRGYAREMDPSEAISQAIDRCIADGLLIDYLQERRSEVISTFLTEWDEEGYRAFLRDESREDGLAEGRAEGEASERSRVVALLIAKVSDGILGIEDAAEIAGCTIEEFEALSGTSSNAASIS